MNEEVLTLDMMMSSEDISYENINILENISKCQQCCKCLQCDLLKKIAEDGFNVNSSVDLDFQ